MEITIQGKKYKISREKIEKAIKGGTPQRVTKYAVSIHGQLFPIKQVISETLQIPLMEFGTMTAYRILRYLDYKILVNKT